jgi:hypothetical protein
VAVGSVNEHQRYAKYKRTPKEKYSFHYNILFHVSFVAGSTNEILDSAVDVVTGCGL